MTDAEIRDALKRIDESEAVDVDSWEAGFLQSILWTTALSDVCIPPANNEVRVLNQASFPLSAKQRAKALEIIDKYEHEHRGEQEVIVKLPPGKERYFRRTE